MSGCGGKGCIVCEFRKIMLEHIFFTREVVAVTVLKAPKAAVDPSIQRLLQNPQDIAKWLLRVLPQQDSAAEKAAKMVEKLFTEHLQQALPIVIAVRDGESKEKIESLQKLWNRNAMDIASTLAMIGKTYGFDWPKEILEKMMLDHLQLTTEEAVLFIQGKYEASLKKFGEVESEMIIMSDALAKGTHRHCKCSRK